MGIGKYAPETAKTALAVAIAMRDKCHACQYSKTERHFGACLHIPDTESETCRDCLAVIQKTSLG